MMITEYEYMFLNGTIGDVMGVVGPSAMLCQVYEYCRESGLCDFSGQITDLGRKAVNKYEAEKGIKHGECK